MVDLPPPLAPDDRDALARGNRQARAIEHGRAPVERERHGVEDHVATDRRERRRGIGLRTPPGSVENLVHAPERHAGGRDAGVQAHEACTGPSSRIW